MREPKETVDFPWLAEPDLDALKGILRHVVDHPEEAWKKGEAGRIQIETNFTWEKAAEVVIQRFHALKFKPILRFEKAAQEKKEPKKGLVSIIIQVSDDPDVFKRCFESIKSHTPEPHEIIFCSRSQALPGDVFTEAPPRFLGTCRHEGHMAIDFHKWKAEPSGMHSHAEHGNEEAHRDKD